MELIKKGAVNWFNSILPAFKDSVYEEYLSVAITALKSDSELIRAEKDPVLDIPLCEFEDELSSRARNILSTAYITTMRDFTYVTKRNILGICNCGKQTAAMIFHFAEKHGVSICDDCIFMHNVFSFKEGDTVVVRSTDRSQRIKEGDILVIKDVDERYYNRQKFKLPLYKCEGSQGVVWLSPGQIRKIEV